MKNALMITALFVAFGNSSAQAALRGMNIYSTARAPGVAGQCLTVKGGSTDSGALIVPAPCLQNQTSAAAASQQWITVAAGVAPGGFNIYVLVNKNSGKCMDAGQGVGQPLVQWECHFDKNQRFAVNNTGYGWANIMALRDMSCIEAYQPNGLDAPTKAYTRNCSGGANEGFHFSAPSTGCSE